MNPVQRWKVSNSTEVEVGIFEGHIIDIMHDLASLSFPEPLIAEKTDEECRCMVLYPLPTNTVRFYITGIKKEILQSPPEVRNAWFQNMFMKEEPKNRNWLVTMTSPYIKIEFI